ncbi:hypothetical protein [Metabacillus niabensis]|uniref:hypothetical protein n=1 Tax=Metabacillus niabensis TaxID=324854 RepID=UPI00399F0B7D
MFLKKKIKTIDTELNELSQLLFLDEKGSFPKQEVLLSIPNDYLIDSLKLIDHYLEAIREANELEENYHSLVLRVGAYVGEVIKINSKKEYHWYDFKTAKKLQPSMKDWEEQIGTAAILYSAETDEMTFPINKVCKFIENGSEDSLFSYAKVMI